MKNDTTWEYSDNSEQNKQQSTTSHGKLVGLRSKTSAHCSLLSALSSGSQSKTPSPIPHSPSPILRSKTPVPRSPFPVPNSSSNFAPSQAKTPSPIPINREAILTLRTRKNYLVRKLVKLREGPLDEKAWIYREANAITGVLDFIWLILKTVHYEQLEKLRNLQQIEDGLLPSTPDSAKIRIPGALESVREAMAAYDEWKQR